MYYKKIKACFDLIEDFENYHLIVRIRPDLVLTERKRVDWKLVHLLASEGFLFAAYGYTLAYYGFGVDDKIAIGTPKKMKLYSDLWEQRKKYFPLTGHTSLALYLFDHKVEVCSLDEILGTQMNDTRSIDQNLLNLILDAIVSYVKNSGLPKR